MDFSPLSSPPAQRPRKARGHILHTLITTALLLTGCSLPQTADTGFSDSWCAPANDPTVGEQLGLLDSPPTGPSAEAQLSGFQGIQTTIRWASNDGMEDLIETGPLSLSMSFEPGTYAYYQEESTECPVELDVEGTYTITLGDAFEEVRLPGFLGFDDSGNQLIRIDDAAVEPSQALNDRLEAFLDASYPGWSTVEITLGASPTPSRDVGLRLHLFVDSSSVSDMSTAKIGGGGNGT